MATTTTTPKGRVARAPARARATRPFGVVVVVAMAGHCRPATGTASATCQAGTGTKVSTMNRRLTQTKCGPSADQMRTRCGLDRPDWPPARTVRAPDLHKHQWAPWDSNPQPAD